MAWGYLLLDDEHADETVQPTLAPPGYADQDGKCQRKGEAIAAVPSWYGLDYDCGSRKNGNGNHTTHTQGEPTMKWCRFQVADQVSYGIIEEQTVIAVTGSPFDTYAKTSTTYPLHEVKLLVPVMPPTFYAAGVNYRQHVIEMAAGR
jgi:hypothetical protein